MLTEEEEMTGINETMAALSSEINGNTGQKNIAALKRDWLKRNTELTLTQESQQKIWEVKKEQLQSDDFRQKELLIKDWNHTADARNWLSSFKQQQWQQRNQCRTNRKFEAEFHPPQQWLRLAEGEYERATGKTNSC